MQPWRKTYECFNYYLCWLRVVASKNEHLSQDEDVCNNHVYCYVEMPKEDTEILKYNHGEKSMKVSFII